MPSSAATPPAGRAAELIATLHLQPHPEGGWFREIFRSPHFVDPRDARPERSALTSIDFLLTQGQFSAWHRVDSDEAWHLLERGPLRLWLVPPALDEVHSVELGHAGAGTLPRHVVPSGWWQAAEPLGEFAYVGATVGPGFEFADFAFGRDGTALRSALQQLRPDLQRLL